MFSFIIFYAFTQWHIGFVAIIFSVIMIFAGCVDQKDVIDKTKWGTVVMVAGSGILASVVQSLGGIDPFQSNRLDSNCSYSSWYLWCCFRCPEYVYSCDVCSNPNPFCNSRGNSNGTWRKQNGYVPMPGSSRKRCLYWNDLPYVFSWRKCILLVDSCKPRCEDNQKQI